MWNARVGRRTIIAAGALGAAAVGGGAQALTRGRPAAAAQTRLSATVTGVDYPGLRKALTGRLLRPGDPGYATAAQPFNAALGVRHPAAIAQVSSRADVATCIRRVRG